LEEDQEVLIVTLVNSAVDNFELRIRENFDNPLLALYKYRVRTLHGLAHDILREKPAQAGLEERFTILDEREADSIRRETVTAWLSSHPDGLEDYLDPSETKKRDWCAVSTCLKCWQAWLWHSSALQGQAYHTRNPGRRLIKFLLAAAELGWQLYADYQRGWSIGAVDFDDLIRLAVMIEDKDYLERLHIVPIHP
jgi:DNA helicase-2/ATP-dependent DNA helicase PcrA